MLNKTAPYGPVTARAATPFVPAAGLGAALAALPQPWLVYRKGGFSSFEQPGEIYGGIYIALHPAKGIVLADMVPAQPGLAISRLRALLHQTGLPAFAEDEPPLVALTLTRGELPNLAARLDEAFAAAPCRIDDPNWTAAAVNALATRFPYLRPVQRVEGGALSLEPVAEIRVPAALRPGTALVPRAGGVDESNAHGQARSYARSRSRSKEEPRQGRAGRYVLGGAAAALALAAIALLPRYARDLIDGSPPPQAPKFSAQIAPPPLAPTPVPDTAAITPMQQNVIPPANLAPVPSMDEAAVPAEKPPVPAMPAAPTRTVKRKEAARQTKTAEREPTTVYVPPHADTPAQAAEQKPKKAAIAARPDRQRRTVEASPPALDNTITVDGLTYIKGREPHALDAETPGTDSTTVPVADSSAATPPASGAPPNTALSAESAPTSVSSPAPFNPQ